MDHRPSLHVLSVPPSLHQDDEEFDDDYESPFSGDEDVSGGDYESPNEDVDGNDYEPPPSEPPEDLPHKLCPPLPPGDDDYIGNNITCQENEFSNTTLYCYNRKHTEREGCGESGL